MSSSRSTLPDSSHAATSARVRWLSQGSCLALALGLCVGAGDAARAQNRPAPTIAPRELATQAVQGTPTFEPGTSFGTRTANTDQIIVTTPGTIINWTTLDTRTTAQTTDYVNFLPSGTTLTFTGPGSDFSVLNRILPTASSTGAYRGVALDGTVNSFLGTSGPQGGSIWFYSPGGVLAGANSAFNVGSLILTTSDLSSSSGFFGTGLAFSGVADPASQIFIDAGAQIVLPNEASYFIAFAPTIVQAGTVDVNGQVTYAVGEVGDGFIDNSGNAGVFVGVGAQAGNALVHTGTTTGPASSGALDSHVVTFLAPGPGVETLLSGNIGYAEATAASLDPNGNIVIFADNVRFGDGQIDSSISVFADDVLSLGVSGIGNVIVFGSATNRVDVALAADNGINLSATSGANISVSGDLVLSAGRIGQGGNISVTVDDAGRDSGTIVSGLIVGGDLVVDGGTVGNTDFDMGFGGDAVGGSLAISVSQGGDISVGGNLSLSARAQGGYGAYTSGNGTGGSVGLTLAGANSSISVGGTLDITVAGTASFNVQTGSNNTGVGSNTTGGSISLDLSQGSLDAAALLLDASATGGDSFGFDGTTYQGYNGGSATGGTIVLTTGAGAAINLGSLDLNASAFGGVGAAQGASSGPSGGGLGGNAQGGSATLNNNGGLAVVDLTIVASGIGGAGGAGQNSTGGNGTGGVAILNHGATISGLSAIGMIALGTGGSGGASQAFGSAYSGGAGGNGTGGTVRLELTGAGTTMQGLGSMGLDAGGIGGDGAYGVYSFGGAANGATGGNGQGGTVELIARTGTTFEFAGSVDALRASGFGGYGGYGGGSSVAGGIGGAGGTGTGGTLRLIAQGGTITGADLDITNTGQGGTGGLGGYGVSSGFAAPGANGGGTGGSVELSALEGSPGVITLGALSIDASGLAGGGDITVPTTGGSIAITDASVDPAGLITLGSLTATAFGTTGAGGDFSIAGDSGPIAITGSLTVDVARDALFAFANDGQVTIGASTTINAGRDVTVTHAGNSGGTFTIDSVDDFFIRAGRDFLSTPGAIAVGRLDIDLRAENTVTASDLRAFRRLLLESGGNFTLGNASIFGPVDTSPDGSTGNLLVNNGIILAAGVDASGAFDPNANLLVTGTVTSSGVILLGAGGSATFAGGSTTLSDNGLQVLTGDDIVIAAGAVVGAAANPANTPDLAAPFASGQNLVLFAGGLAGSLSGPAPTPISSLVIDGTIDSNTFATTLLADAIDGLDGTLLGSSLQADILNAPAAGLPQSNDNGLLAAPCLEGNVCLGTVAFDNIVAIGQASPNDVIAFAGGQGGMSAAQFLLTTREGITLGSAGAASTIAGSSQLVIESLTGDVTLLDTTITGDQILVTAAGSLLGSGSFVSANDIGIDVGADLVAALIDTGGQLTTVAGVGGAIEPVYAVAGSLTVGAMVQGAAAPAAFTAGGDIAFGSIVTAGQPIALTAANGSAFLGTTTQAGAGAITITAQDVSFTDLVAAGTIGLTATVGGIAGGSLAAGSIVSLDAATDIAIGPVTAGQFDATAGAGFATTGAIVTTGGTTITSTTGGIDLTALSAANATITANGGPVSISGTTVAGLLSVAGTSVLVSAPGALTVSALASGGNVDLTSGGTLTVGSTSASGALTLTTTGLLAVTGPASGTTVNTRSADLDIAAGGTLGGGSTTAITIVSDGTSALTLGGTGTAGGFALSAAEVGRIFSTGDLTIRALDPGTGLAALVVDNVTFNAFGASVPGQIGPAGTLLLDTDGSALVRGALVLTGAGATTTLQVVTAGSLRINAAAGNLRIENGNGGLAGRMFLTARDIFAMTDAAFADIQGQSIAAIDARLALNDGVNRPLGMIQADALTIETTASQVFIQNTGVGTATDGRRGFTANSLTLNDSAGTIQPIVINGVIGTATGLAAIPLAQVNSTYADGSTINGCIIASPAQCRPSQRPDVIPEDVSELIEREILDDLPDEIGKLVPGSMLIDLAEQEVNRRDPLIDEPVTGAGNDDLWVVEPDCDAEGEARDASCPLPREQ